MTASLVSEIERLADAMNEGDSEAAGVSLQRLAERMAQVLRVQKDEVAILLLSDRMRILRFLVPEQLCHVGFIPLSSAHALAARTVRNGKPEIINNFADARHLNVFESVPLGREPGEVIQKIMSAPIKIESRVIGVVEVSHKGRTLAQAGPDFTQQDLRELTTLARALGKFLKYFPRD
jgi:GAF domain-containing protein